jgi:ComF family protein
MLDQLVALVAPPRCAACRAPGRRATDVLCGACRRALPWLGQPCCPRCALPLPHLAACPARDAPFDAAWSAVAYEGVARDAMRALKFSAARPLAEVMAAQIAANAPAALLAAEVARAARAGPLAPEEVALVAVPAHPARRRARGFDPAELLARALARKTGLALARPLRRSAASSRQLGADRATRRAAARLAFAARGPAPRTAILVDDVHTTGATLAACAHALKQAGAQRVVALTWARTL